MTEPRIEGFSPSDFSSSSPDIQKMAKELKNDIDQFNDLIPPRPDQIDAFSTAIQRLHDAAHLALQMTKHPTNKLMEEVQDAALTAQTILTQQLNLRDMEQDISLIAAAKKHKDSPNEESELAKIGRAFVQYPDQTQALKAELSLTSHDLKR